METLFPALDVVPTDASAASYPDISGSLGPDDRRLASPKPAAGDAAISGTTAARPMDQRDESALGVPPLTDATGTPPADARGGSQANDPTDGSQ